MTRPNRKQAPEGAEGTCRRSRKRYWSHPRAAMRPGWLGSFRRAHRALDACIGMVRACLRTVAAYEGCAGQRPVRTSKELHHAEGVLVQASAYLTRAARELAEANEWIGREPERARFAPQGLIAETQRWIEVAAWLNEVSAQVFDLHEVVIEGLVTGTFVPEPEPAPRPRRIAITPRPLFVRAFLAARRQPRVSDRITPVLLRRRRTPRPAEVRVPRRNLRGRAPPLPSVCAF